MAVTGRNLVNLERARVVLGSQVVLEEVSLGVGAGERVGVLGRNGGGKTTLLQLLAGRRTPDAGRLTHTRDLRLGYLPQADALPAGATVRQVTLGDAAEHTWASRAHVRGVLAGLLGGLGAPVLRAGLDTPVDTLSGGERRRVALAGLLSGEHDLLVLDEPTNHLDVEGIDWLARHLRAQRAALVVVTHDRWFLDTVCERTWEVHDGVVEEYDGGYAAYVLARAERARLAAADQARRDNLLRKELAWLRRGPPARTSKPRFRIDAANDLIADEPPPRDTVELARFATARLGRTVFEAHDLTLAVGGHELLEHLTWNVGPGDRLGILGVNGSGKTSLLRMLTGQLAPVSGRLVTGRTVAAALLSQDLAELPAGRRVLESVEEIRRVVRVGKRELTATSLLETLGFTGDRQWTPVEELSGGERRRLQLLRLLVTEPNVLLLDEPTNDLDIDTLTALEDLLDAFAGTLLVVSHDRWFLERVCDRVVALLGDGALRELPGGVEEYLARRHALAVGGAGGGAGGAGGAERLGTPQPLGSARRREARKELVRIERALARAEAAEGRLHEELARYATDHVVVADLDARLRAVHAERAELEERWLELAETVGD